MPANPPDDDLPAIAVTGIACRFPGADSPEEFWELLRDGRDLFEEVPADELRRAAVREPIPGGPCHVPVRRRFTDPGLFDAAAFRMTAAEAELTDPQQRILLELAVHALQDAGIDRERFPGPIGVVIGLNHSEYLLRNVLAHPEVVRTHGWHRVLMGNDRGFTATQISYRLGLTGPSLAVDCGCSASLVAVHQAVRMLLDYEADAVLTGGAAIRPDDVGYEYTPGGIVSPDGRCRPFSADAAGTVFASGAGLVVLRRLDDALADGDRVLALIRASAVNNDGARKSGYTAPSIAGQAELVAGVHRLAGIAADRVGHLEAHGTATLLGDPIEVAALTEAFRRTTTATGFCALGSVKSNIGHLDSAAGIAGLIKTVLLLQHRALPPSLGCERTNPHIDFGSSPFRLSAELCPWESETPRMAGVSAFGVGGTNAHVLLEESPEVPARRLPAPTLQRFERQRYWLEAGAPPAVGAPGVPDAAAPGEPVRIEGALAVFRTVLGLEEISPQDVSPEDDLYVLGGDSLTAQRVVALSAERWGVAIPLGSFLDEPTPQRLAELAGLAEPGEPATVASPKTGDAERELLPLTTLQERFLFLDEVPGAAEAHHVPVLTELRGPLDVAALRAALQDVVDRHDALRLRFHLSELEPRFEILPAAAVELPVWDVEDDDALRVCVNDLLSVAIPLDRAPLLAARLFRRSNERHVLAIVVHHICADAHSTGLILRDLFARYEHHTGTGTPELPVLDGLLAEHARAQAAWLASTAADRQAAFWRAELTDLPAPLALPGHPRTAERGYRGGLVEFVLSEAVSTQVRAVAERARVTPFTVVFAAFCALLGRLGEQSEVVVGTPVAGRHHPRTRDLVGNFVNTLPLRVRIRPEDDFLALVEHVSGRLRAALDHQDLPFEVLARRIDRAPDQREAPLIDVLFNMLSADASEADAPAGLTAHPVPFEYAGSPYELSLDWWFEPDGRLGGRLRYDRDRFEHTAVEDWSALFAHLLERFTADPARAVGRVPALPAAGTRAAAALHGPVVDVPDLPVHEVFADQARREPDRLAVSGGGVELTYGALAQVSAAVAGLLAGHGVRPGDRVGLALPKGVPAVAALLGVVRAGAVAVPFDLALPAARLTVMAEDCAPVVVLGEHPAQVGFAPAAEPVVLPALSELRSRPAPAVLPTVTGDDLVYLTFTSGSTGRPKPIAFPHRALSNLIHWETEGYHRALRWLQFASLGFDAAFHEIFGALCGGGSLHVADEETRYDHELLASFVAEHGIQKAIWPVSLLNSVAAVFQDDAAAFASLREVAATGEQLRLGEGVVAFFEALPGCRLVNNYGPAETHVVTSYPFQGHPSAWPRYAPIGRPLPNTVMRLTAPDGRDVPYGTTGELRIGGVCVADGYLARPELTVERFERVDGVPFYRSGDRARLLPGGDLEFLGRDDRQIKIRGYRVELAEVDLAIRRVPGVRDVAVVAAGEDGARRIDAYLVVDNEPAGQVEKVRKQLLAELPQAMVPSTFTVLDALPVNANGKVVPALLPPPGRTAAPSATPPTSPPAETPACAPPQTPTAPAPAMAADPAGQVLALFRRVLGRPELDPDDDFFAAGGHSLLAARVLYGLRDGFAARLSVAEFYRCRTAAQVARLLAARGTGGPHNGGRLPELPADGPPPVLPPGLRHLTRPEAAATSKTFVLALGTRPEPRRLRLALEAVLRRHPALRLCAEPDGSALRVRPLDELDPVVIEVTPGCSVEPADLPAWLHRSAQTGVPDPRRDPLLRLMLATPPDGPALLALTVHPLALDGLGLLSLCHDLSAAYQAPGSLGPEDRGFLRQLAWRHDLVGTTPAKRAAEMWRSLLGGPVVSPDADARSSGGASDENAAATIDGATESRWAPRPELHAAIRSACARDGVAPYAVQLTAFAIAAAVADGGELRIALPWDGRAGAGLETSVGAFADIVPLPVTIRPGQSAGAVLSAVRATLDRIAAVRPVPYADLAAADPDLDCAPDVVFGYAWDDGGDLTFAGRAARWVGPEPLQPGVRVHLSVVDGADGFRVHARSRADGPGAAALLAAYRTALYALAFDPQARADARPDTEGTSEDV
ncbi:non-ribosomal peptide synthetase [Streptomyces sp. N2A]|uniref:non-ribosomal peptide synthetase n=1 Tax=Streptomyces sp. N2A TaxID=3073936 RepID=UPI00287043C8|nr:non-ribosomal peptide synthetase [Streptomyces sp. N2A]